MTDRPTTSLSEALRAIAPQGVQLGVAPADSVASVFDVSIRVSSLTHELKTGWAGDGWPSDVERLLRLAPRLDAVAARALSVGARELLEDRGIGWFDTTGAAHLVLDSGLVIVRPGTSRPSEEVPRPTHWTQSTVTVAEAILTGSIPRVAAVQRATGLSRGAVANALALLEDDALLKRSVARGPSSGRSVTDTNELLEQYAAAVAATASKTPAIFLHRLWRDPLDALTNEIAPALDRAGVSWVVTGAAASTLLAPYLSNLSVVELYIDDERFGDATWLENLLNARQVEQGHRVEVRPKPTLLTMTASEAIAGVRSAPLVRVYADLMAKGGRWAEAAHHLKELRIDARTKS